jgi:UDP-N-acetylmuramoyl-tripeptide--D-alanyl-D-alanine ligase
MMKLTPEAVARALALKVPTPSQGHVPSSFSSVVTDSRQIKPGCLFVCLKGDNFDAHDFIPQAIQQGAKGVVCRRGTRVEETSGSPPEKSIGVLLFYVEDTLKAFRSLAHQWRREFSYPVVAVAGSVGKTTTKEILAAALSGKFPSVLKTQGSNNGFIGIPMTLLEMRPEHQAAVIEVGIDEIGAMKEHLELVGATASVLTTIGPEHLEKLIDIPTVAREEGLALSVVAKAGGMVAINLDDPWIKPHAEQIQGTKTTYSLSQSDAELFGQYSAADNTLLVKQNSDQSEATYNQPLPGLHNAINTLAAIAICTGLGSTPAEIQKGLKNFKAAAGRSEVRTIGTVQVLCDYYNANPTSTEAGIELLTQIAKRANSKSRFACLADMLELGTEEEKFHRELAASLIQHRIEHIYLFGDRMKWLADELTSRGYSGELKHFERREILSGTLAQSVNPGDAVLIKGSHSMKMEDVRKSLEQCLPTS